MPSSGIFYKSVGFQTSFESVDLLFQSLHLITGRLFIIKQGDQVFLCSDQIRADQVYRLKAGSDFLCLRLQVFLRFLMQTFRFFLHSSETGLYALGLIDHIGIGIRKTGVEIRLDRQKITDFLADLVCGVRFTAVDTNLDQRQDKEGDHTVRSKNQQKEGQDRFPDSQRKAAEEGI